MRVYKQFYMIFVLMRACLWNVGSSFGADGNTDITPDNIMTGGEMGDNTIMAASRDILYATDNTVTEQDDFLRTPASRVTALPVFHRDATYSKKSINGERARFLKLLLFPNHSFG